MSTSPRVLVVLPSWLGDCVMATPTLRLLRDALPRSVIIGLGRPGMDDLLAGCELLDDVVIADGRSVVGPARAAAKIMPLKVDAALLLPNSFSTAMGVRLAGVPIRVGYERDARGLLLTHSLEPPKKSAPKWSTSGYEPISAVDYYFAIGRELLRALEERRGVDGAGFAVSVGANTPRQLELGVTRSQEQAARDLISRAGVRDGESFVLLNPGGNNPAKRWPVERFAGVAHHVINTHGVKVLINGSPAEAEVVSLIRDAIVLNHPADGERIACLTELGITIGGLKGVVSHARAMVTNDTGPRHLAAAFGVPCVTLFGPTDPRWTTLPDSVTVAHAHEPDAQRDKAIPREVIMVADSTLPASEVADEHPLRCRIDRITTEAVLAAVDRVMGG